VHSELRGSVDDLEKGEAWPGKSRPSCSRGGNTAPGKFSSPSLSVSPLRKKRKKLPHGPRGYLSAKRVHSGSHQRKPLPGGCRRGGFPSWESTSPGKRLLGQHRRPPAHPGSADSSPKPSRAPRKPSWAPRIFETSTKEGFFLKSLLRSSADSGGGENFDTLPWRGVSLEGDSWTPFLGSCPLEEKKKRLEKGQFKKILSARGGNAAGRGGMFSRARGKPRLQISRYEKVACRGSGPGGCALRGGETIFSKGLV